MKKVLSVLAAVVVCGAAVHAQNQVNVFGFDTQIPASYIPGVFMVNGHPGCAVIDVDQENLVNSTIKFYNHQLQPTGNPIAVPAATIANGLTREEYYNPSTRQWELESTGRVRSLVRIPALTAYMEFGQSGVESTTMFLMTQALFDRDEEMEFLTPVVSYAADTDYHENGHFGNGVYSDSRTIKNHVVATAFRVEKAGGDVVTTITLPTGYVSPALSEDKVALFAVAFVKFMGNYYCLVPAVDYSIEDNDERTKLFVYQITPAGGSQASVALVNDGIPMSVFPTLVNRGGDITVDLGDNGDAREIRVIDQSGRVVKTVPVEAGQRQVKVSTADVNPGVSFINALFGRQQSSYKVVIR